MFILASQSPRRKQLMSEITSAFSIIVSNVEEIIDHNDSPLEACQKIAFSKGEIIAKDYFDDVVISADTIVVIDNQIIGKPKDLDDAKRILRLLSNNKHEVITCYSIFNKGKVISNHCISSVYFNYLSDELINDYVDSKSPLDKAGAYGVQDNETYHIISHVEGSIKNVIGFPVEEIKNDLITNRLL